MPSVPSILLAEDNPDDVLLLKRAFERVHFANPLHVVKDGAEAIAYLSGEGKFADRNRYPLPFILLLDLGMPRRSGFDVLQWVRQRPEFNSMEIAVLTSSKESTDVVKAFECGAASYLVKSADFEDLFDLVKRLGCYLVITNEKPERPTLEETLITI
jgi:CheY-like chemotaxis protein